MLCFPDLEKMEERGYIEIVQDPNNLLSPIALFRESLLSKSLDGNPSDIDGHHTEWKILGWVLGESVDVSGQGQRLGIHHQVESVHEPQESSPPKVCRRVRPCSQWHPYRGQSKRAPVSFL